MGPRKRHAILLCSAFHLTACSGGSAASTPADAQAAADARDDASDASQSGDAGAEDATADAGDAATDSPVTACVAAINHYRAMVGSPPVVDQTSDDMCAAGQAAKGAADLAATGKTTFHKYFRECGESYQNECWYSVDDPAAVIAWCMAAFWAEGPPDTGINHYSVMTDPKSTAVACGFAHLDGGGYWMTNDYY